MSKIKFCGLKRPQDITIANELLPDFIGFVFWEKSKRSVTPDKAMQLMKELDARIKAVGVFVDESPEIVADLANKRIIDIIQLHGHEDEKYIESLRKLTAAEIIKAFQIRHKDKESNAAMDSDNGIGEVIREINNSSADMVLVDSGQGTGKAFDWEILKNIERPYFLAGGINTDNIEEAVKISPYAVDVSSGIETEGVKDEEKMKKIIEAIRKYEVEK